MTVDQRKLLATTDAMVWAEEFMAEFGNRREDIDEGLMVGWFANAMMTAEHYALCWEQEPGKYTACDRKRNHLGLHSWASW